MTRVSSKIRCKECAVLVETFADLRENRSFIVAGSGASPRAGAHMVSPSFFAQVWKLTEEWITHLEPYGAGVTAHIEPLPRWARKGTPAERPAVELAASLLDVSPSTFDRALHKKSERANILKPPPPSPEWDAKEKEIQAEEKDARIDAYFAGDRPLPPAEAYRAEKERRARVKAVSP